MVGGAPRPVSNGSFTWERSLTVSTSTSGPSSIAGTGLRSRGTLGYTGAVCTDDLGMEGARHAGSPLDACIAALNAGCDLVMVCNQSKVDGGRPLDQVLDGLESGLEQGRWQANPASESRRLDLLPQSAPMPWDDLMHHAPYRHALDRLP